MKALLTIVTMMMMVLSVKGQNSSFSATLPVMYLNTEQPVTSKEDYVWAKMWIDAMGCEWAVPTGSPEEPVSMLIRGRGNWTWSDQFAKKSYRLRFIDEISLLGMSENRHFVLLAHADAQCSFFRNHAGFYLSRRFGLAYTPQERAVEVVMNGDYIGLYMLTETVRVDENRVNITKQKDEETDEALISGGWLVEIDNTDEERQLKMPTTGTPLERFWVTYHMPERLSEKQKDYLYSQMAAILESLYTTDKRSTAWEGLIDLDVVACYYLLSELIDHVEAFQGSCYLYKDRGEEKWKFGPLWDLGHALNTWHAKTRHIYDVDDWDKDISEELMKFPRFQERVKELLLSVGETYVNDLYQDLTLYGDTIRAAFDCNRARWPKLYRFSIDELLPLMKERLDEKLDFLFKEAQSDFNGVDGVTVGNERKKGSERLYDLSGRPVKEGQTKGVVIRRGKKTTNNVN